MKKIVILAAVAALAVVTFTSCNKAKPDKPQFGKAVVTAKYSISEDMDAIADVTLNITRFDGKIMEMPVSTNEQSVDIEVYKGTIPADLSYNFVFTQNGPLDKDSYDLNLNYEIIVKVYDSNGKEKQSKKSSSEDRYDKVAKNRIDAMIALYNINGCKLSINEDLSISEAPLN